MFSIVIPVYNEEESLQKLYSEIAQVAHQRRYEIEVVFVDDGSSDNSWKIIEQLVRDHDHVQGIRFRRNFGKAAALSAGFETAIGEIVFTMDADLQDDPVELPRFLDALETQDLDVVSGWKEVRHDPIHKTFPSKVFNWLVGAMTGVKLHDHNCGYKCYRSEIFDEIFLYGEMHRFVPVLAAARGWKVGEIPVHHRAREYGKSKYGFRRFIKGFLDLLTVYFLTCYRQRPQHLLGTMGVTSFGLGMIGLTYMAIYWVYRMTTDAELIPLHQRPLLIYSLGALLLGAQLMSIGFLAELITAYQGKRSDSYSVKERIRSEAKAASQLASESTPVEVDPTQQTSDPSSQFSMNDPSGLHAESKSTSFGDESKSLES